MPQNSPLIDEGDYENLDLSAHDNIRDFSFQCVNEHVPVCTRILSHQEKGSQDWVATSQSCLGRTFFVTKVLLVLCDFSIPQMLICLVYKNALAPMSSNSLLACHSVIQYHWSHKLWFIEFEIVELTPIHKLRYLELKNTFLKLVKFK